MQTPNEFTFLKQCPMCQEWNELTLKGKKVLEKYREWTLGKAFIQDIPLPANEREFLKTGYCNECQKLLFESDEEEGD